MAIKVGYVTREVGINLTRNISLTLATIATVAVSLTLVGSALLIGEGVQDAQRQFEGGVEFIVFMRPDASDAQIDAVRAELDANPGVDEANFCNQECAFEEFQEIFSDDPSLQESVQPESLPPSFRVHPVDASADAVASLGAVFEGQPGVREVVFSSEAIARIERFYDFLATRSGVAALALVGAATLLVLNTIQMAILNRRRDIEVMKLVGATNLFIRLPFMVEGLIQGLLGALLAIPVVSWFIRDLESHAEGAGLLAAFQVTASQITTVSIWMVIAGAVVSLVGSGIAVSRFLKV